MLLNRLKLDKLDVRGKQPYQLATLLTGSSSGFRELFDQYGITPFDPQTQIDKLGILSKVSEVQKKIGVIGSGSLINLSRLQPTSRNPEVKLDWLN